MADNNNNADVVKDEWVRFGFAEEDWYELGAEDRGEVRKRAVDAKAEEVKREATLAGSKGSKAEALTALIGQMLGDVELALLLTSSLNTAEKLKGFATYLVSFADRGIDFRNMDKKIVKELFELDPDVLSARVDMDRERNVPLTIHNYGEIISSHPAIKCGGISKERGIYLVGEQTYFVNLADNLKGFCEACTLVSAVAGLERKTNYIPFIYDEYVEVLTRILVLHFDTEVEGSGIKMKRKTAMGLPTGVTHDAHKAVNLVIKAFEEMMKGRETQIIPVVAKERTTMLPRMYAAIVENKWMEDKALRSAVRILYLSHKSQLKVIYDATKEQIDNWIDNARKGVDNSFAELKKTLDDSRAWRERSRITDVESHDWMMDGDYIHLPAKKWGVAHMIKLILDILEGEDMSSITVFEMIGSRAVDTARAMDLVPKENDKEPFPALGDGVIKTLIGKGNVLSVNGWKCTPATEGMKTMPSVDATSGKYVMIVTDFLEEKADVEKQVTAILAKFRATESRIKDFKLVVATNMMGFGRFEQLLHLCKTFECGLELWKHPRLHNDAIYLIFDSQSKLSGDIVRMWFRYLYVARENNHVRNVGIFVGVKPQRKKWEGDPHTIMGIYSAMRLGDLGKSAKFRVDRTGLRPGQIAFDLINSQSGGLGSQPPNNKPQEGQQQTDPPDKGRNTNKEEDVGMSENKTRGREEPGAEEEGEEVEVDPGQQPPKKATVKPKKKKLKK